MAQDKGKRPPQSEAGDAPESVAPPVAASLQSIDAPLLSPELPAGRAMELSADPVGGLTALMSEANPVTGQLNAMAPTFANVLRSIGEGVASSQATMDKGLKDTIEKLKGTKIKVVTQVVQELDDDGLPREEGPDLVVKEQSLINFVEPNQQVWRSIKLSMDMTVSDVSTEHGMTFKRDQTSVVSHGHSMPWGFGNWFSVSGYGTHAEQTSTNTSNTTWSSGQVRLDAQLESRHADRLPVGVEVEIGPKIYFSQGPVRETRGKTSTRREVDVAVQVQQASAAVNPDVRLVMTCTQLSASFSGETGSKTDENGNAVITVTREVPTGAPPVPLTGTITVRLGDIVRTLDITL
jgi:hypothetical protein